MEAWERFQAGLSRTPFGEMKWLAEADWFRGLRAATAISAPMLAGDLLHQPAMLWAALGGFEAIFSDKGGPYRSRIGRLGLLTLGGAAGCIVGTLTGGSLATALPATLLWCFLWSYLVVLGDPFASAGPLVQLIFICGLGAPSGSPREALVRAGFLLLGGAWAMLLSLFLWPIDPYRPARFALADCYRELAAFLGSIHELNLRKQIRPALWHRLARRHQSRLRRQLEAARHAVSSVRAETAAETIRGRNLVVLLESADLLLARTVALAEYMEMTAEQDASPCTVRGKASILLLEEAAEWVSTALTRRLRDLEESSHQRRARLQRIPAEVTQCMSPEDIPGQFLVHQLVDATQNLDTAIESAVAVRLGREQRPAARRRTILWPQRKAAAGSWFEPLASNWNRESLMLRHAARVALVCGLDICLILWFRIDHGYWLMLTSLIVLQPNVGGTLRRSLQRIGGTVAGGMLAAVLAVYLRSQAATAIALFPLGFLSLAVLPLSYSLFCFFLTPTFVLAFLPRVGDWQLAWVRIADTAAGALIAAAAMALLWPALERRRFGGQLLRSLEANRRYLRCLAEAWRPDAAADATAHQRALAAARRAIGLTHNESEDSLDRLILEPDFRGRSSAGVTEAAIAFVTYLRRFGQSITTLASLPGEAAWKLSAEVRQAIRRYDAALEALAASAAGRAASWPRQEETRAAPGTPPRHSGQRQLVRMDRQLGVLRRALETMQRGGLLPQPPGMAPQPDQADSPEVNVDRNKIAAESVIRHADFPRP